MDEWNMEIRKAGSMDKDKVALNATKTDIRLLLLFADIPSQSSALTERPTFFS